MTAAEDVELLTALAGQPQNPTPVEQPLPGAPFDDGEVMEQFHHEIIIAYNKVVTWMLYRYSWEWYIPSQDYDSLDQATFRA